MPPTGCWKVRERRTSPVLVALLLFQIRYDRNSPWVTLQSLGYYSRPSFWLMRLHLPIMKTAFSFFPCQERAGSSQGCPCSSLISELCLGSAGPCARQPGRGLSAHHSFSKWGWARAAGWRGILSRSTGHYLALQSGFSACVVLIQVVIHRPEENENQ